MRHQRATSAITPQRDLCIWQQRFVQSHAQTMDILVIMLSSLLLVFMIKHCSSLRGLQFHLAWSNEWVTSHQVGDEALQRSSSECAAYCAPKGLCEGFTYSKITKKCVCFEVATNYIRAPEAGTNVYRLCLGGKPHSSYFFLSYLNISKTSLCIKFLQRLQKIIYLQLSTYCFMKIYLKSTGPINWREIFMKQSVGKCR